MTDPQRRGARVRSPVGLSQTLRAVLLVLATHGLPSLADAALQVSRIDLAYPNRSALLAAGWDFVARKAAGGPRNTEQTGALAVSYDLRAHPGTIRIPVGPGENWHNLNSSQNTLFRDLPANWVSIRLKILAFTPVANFQQVGLLAYQDDDNYVNLSRNFVDRAQIELYAEREGVVPAKAAIAPLVSSGNLILRLDRNPARNLFTASYSTTDGDSWTELPGSVRSVQSRSRLGIQVGANQAADPVAADLAWVEIHVAGPAAPVPSITTLTPPDGPESGETTVTITGTDLLTTTGVRFAGASAAFTIESATLITATTPPGIGKVDVRVENADAAVTMAGGFTYLPTTPEAGRFELGHADRAALLGVGWSYVARSGTGKPRNTEQTAGLAPDYDQTTHPGQIRIPLGKGELWQQLNSSENTLFRPLPAEWTSIRLKIMAFSPSANYQQVGLLAYQDDDNYVNLNRVYIDEPRLELFGETFGQVTVKAGAVALPTTTNLILRLDRDPATDTFRAFYSVDDGATWTDVPGSVSKILPSPRLGIHAGANGTGAPAVADLAWVEILTR